MPVWKFLYVLALLNDSLSLFVTNVRMMLMVLSPQSSRRCVALSRLMTVRTSLSKGCKVTYMNEQKMDCGRGLHHQQSNFVITLERAVVGTKVDTNCDEELWSSDVFDAEVHPHVPPARTLPGLLVKYTQRVMGVLGAWHCNERMTSACTAKHPKPAESGYLVRSVPIQTSGKEGIRRRLADAAGVDSEGLQLKATRPADALLIMSGSHPLRRLPLLKRAFLDVNDGIKLASSMRDRGLLPKGLTIWAVANPLTEAHEAGLERLRQKVELGAEVILTQPPLAWEPFERWLRDMHASRALEGVQDEAQAKNENAVSATINHRVASNGKGAKLIVGMPVITSRSGLGFWLELCGVDKCDRICKEAFETFENPKTLTTASRAECAVSSTSTELDAISGVKTAHSNITEGPHQNGGTDTHVELKVSRYGRAWFETTLLKLRDLDHLGVAGIHVMCPGPGPRRRVKELMDDGVFNVWRR